MPHPMGYNSAQERPLRQRVLEMYNQLRSERAGFLDQWQENSRFVNPRRYRFEKERNNQGGRRNRFIVDGRGTRACRTAVAGMGVGVTPSSRPWFMYSHPNREIRELPDVRTWLHGTAEEARNILRRTNFYQVMPSFYMDMLTFSNACLLVDDDKEDLLRFTCVPVGSWCISNNHRMQARTFMREFRLTVRQVIEKFCKKLPDGQYDLSNVSLPVAELFRAGSSETQVDITHLVIPNDNFDKNKLGHRGKKYLSIYYEVTVLTDTAYGDYGASSGGQEHLRISGYDMFPVLVGRWGLTSGDSYGTWGPTDIAIGDIRELQFFARQQAEASVRQISPALVGGSRLNKKKGRLPGPLEVLWLNDPKAADSLRRIYDFNFDIQHTTELRQDIRNSIDESYYVDMFRRFTATNRQYMTAKQVTEESQEKMVELGPVLEIFNEDVLNPLNNLLFQKAYKKGLLPEAPEELEGDDISVEYVSILHQAQKLLDASAIERYVGFIGGVAGIAPAVLDKLNEYEVADQYAEITSAPPGIVRSDEEATARAEQRAEAEARQARLDDAQQESEAIKNIGGAQVGGGSALDALTEGEAVESA